LPGTYSLKFLKFEKVLTITILRGKKWDNGSIFDERTGTVFKINQSPYLFLAIGELK